jgi:hypothetical protein
VLPKAGPYVDLAVHLVDKPHAGKAADLLRDAQRLAWELLRTAAVGSLIWEIHFLLPQGLGQPPLVFHRA